MARSPLDRDDLEGLLRDLMTRLERQERHTHNFPRPAPPGPAPAPPYVPPPEPTPTCEPWCDDFARADGSVGGDWELGFGTGSGEIRQPLFIDGGAAVYGGYPLDGGDNEVGTINWVDEVDCPDQYIEAVIANWHRTGTFSHATVELHTLGDWSLGAPDDPFYAPSRRAVFFGWSTIGGGNLRIQAYTFNDDGDTTVGVTVNYPGVPGDTGPRTLRLESYATGRQVVYLDGVEIIDYVETEGIFAGNGRLQGVWMGWPRAAGDTSPRILDICGGPLTPAARRGRVRVPRAPEAR